MNNTGKPGSKFDEFLNIARSLNQIGITPLLMGSVGLELVTGRDWNAGDLDIHVPGDEGGWSVAPDKNVYQWEQIIALMEAIGYVLTDLHEHEFTRDNQTVEFGIIDTLPSFAGVNISDLELRDIGGVKFYLPNAEQYLKIYEASAEDSYRAEQGNNKDNPKIDYLRSLQKG